MDTENPALAPLSQRPPSLSSCWSPGRRGGAGGEGRGTPARVCLTCGLPWARHSARRAVARPSGLPGLATLLFGILCPCCALSRARLLTATYFYICLFTRPHCPVSSMTSGGSRASREVRGWGNPSKPRRLQFLGAWNSAWNRVGAPQLFAGQMHPVSSVVTGTESTGLGPTGGRHKVPLEAPSLVSTSPQSAVRPSSSPGQTPMGLRVCPGTPGLWCPPRKQKPGPELWALDQTPDRSQRGIVAEAMAQNSPTGAGRLGWEGRSGELCPPNGATLGPGVLPWDTLGETRSLWPCHVGQCDPAPPPPRAPDPKFESCCSYHLVCVLDQDQKHLMQVPALARGPHGPPPSGGLPQATGTLKGAPRGVMGAPRAGKDRWSGAGRPVCWGPFSVV